MRERELFSRGAWVLNLLLLALLSLVAADALNRAVAGPADIGEFTAGLSLKPTASGASYVPDSGAVLERDLFKAAVVPAAHKPARSPEKQSIVRTLALKLLGIVFFAPGHPSNAATIHDGEGTRVLRQGDSISIKYSIESVGLNEVVIKDKDGDTARLGFANRGGLPAPALLPAPRDEVMRISPTEYVLDRRFVRRELADPGSLLSVGLFPVRDDASGNLSGFRVRSIKKGGLADRLGLMMNDLITSINGEPPSIQTASRLAGKLDEMNEISLTIVRDGAPVEMRYRMTSE